MNFFYTIPLTEGLKTNILFILLLIRKVNWERKAQYYKFNSGPVHLEINLISPNYLDTIFHNTISFFTTAKFKNNQAVTN